MKAVKLLAVGAFVVLLGGIVGADDKKDNAKLVVGKWQVSKADPGTVPAGTLVEFTKDGKLNITAKKDDKELSISGTYKLEGDKLTMSMKVGDLEKTKAITITKITAKAMATKDEDGKVVELTRK